MCDAGVEIRIDGDGETRAAGQDMHGYVDGVLTEAAFDKEGW
jgi:hypothetical protein